MPTPDQLSRLAAAANLLRPDWPTQWVHSYLLTRHANRPYKDLGLALFWVATDPETRAPTRLEEPGPWWKTNPDSPTSRTPVPHRLCTICHHPHDPDRPTEHRGAGTPPTDTYRHARDSLNEVTR